VSINPAILKTLSERGWVHCVGKREVPGRPELLGTTKPFLDDFGLKSLDELAQHLFNSDGEAES